MRQEFRNCSWFVIFVIPTRLGAKNGRGGLPFIKVVQRSSLDKFCRQTSLIKKMGVGGVVVIAKY